MKELSLVIPLYNEEKSLDELYQNIKNVLKNLSLNYEIIFVDDGSTDKSLEILEKIANEDNKVKIIQFRKNFGKSAAYSAGFKLSDGEVIITMDADLQDEPADIPEFLKKIKEGYDLVVGWKGRFLFGKNLLSKFFNFFCAFFTGIKLHDFNCPFKAYKKELVKELKIYGELYRYIPVIAHFKGYKICEIKVENLPRKYGSSKYGLRKYFRGFFDFITIIFLSSYTKKPLHLFGGIGLLFFFLGFLADLYPLIKKIIYGIPFAVHSYLILFGILLIIMGVQLISIGLLGELFINIYSKEEEYSVKKVLGG